MYMFDFNIQFEVLFCVQNEALLVHHSILYILKYLNYYQNLKYIVRCNEWKKATGYVIISHYLILVTGATKTIKSQKDKIDICCNYQKLSKLMQEISKMLFLII